jgi:uncharacterized membrane-anchored protein
MRYLFGLVLAFAFSAYAESPAPSSQPAQAKMTAEQLESSLKYQKGDVTLPNGIAELKIPDGFRYVGPEDARRVLEQAWGNPSGEGTLGMLFPANAGPTANDSWGVVITYEEDGHVSDDDADSINYDDLLKQMQEASAAINAERAKQGFSAVELVGWAAKPYYDKSAKKIYWAKELKVADAPQNTLNYNVRILGRKGVLVLTAVAGMSQLSAIEKDMKDVLAFTNFTKGNAYADFDSKVDKTAAYGLAALVAGGIAAKSGLLAKLLALLIAGKKVVILAVVGLIAVAAKFFRRKRS